MEISADRQWTEHELALYRRLSPDYKALSTALEGRSIDRFHSRKMPAAGIDGHKT